jgi:hypothetical protein
MRCLLLVCLVAAAACDVPQDDIDFVTCTELCTCIGGLPSSQASCQASCETNLAPVDPDCSECVASTSNSCATMLDACIPICTTQPTPLEGGM